ncbi:MAG: hypothetical protein CFK52_09045 [Chloracidobacterium sp. CP2_5A]|nr:MAG: hypothetical protein CFK52_09045 [Chloracidobacterium sp. CP2_5A]
MGGRAGLLARLADRSPPLPKLPRPPAASRGIAMVKRFHGRSRAISLALAVALGLSAAAVWGNWLGARRALYLDRRIHAVASPAAGQVVQRGADGAARVIVAGRVGWLAQTVEAGFPRAAAPVIGESDWQSLGAASWTRFQGALTLPTGCHRLLIRVGEPRPPQAFNHVEAYEVCVGEVFVIAGQSNAAGSCRVLFSAVSPLVRAGLIGDDGQMAWKLCSDPQVVNGGGSAWPLVGDALTKRLNAPVGFVNLAVGGSGVRDWRPGTPNFARLAETLRRLQPQGARAVLWHQGESDSGMTADEYAAHLSAIIAAAREAAGGDGPPWLVAQASFKDGQRYDGPRAGQRRVCETGLARPGPDTDQLGLNLRQPDRVHFNEEGTRAAAQLWTRAILTEIFHLPPEL